MPSSHKRHISAPCVALIHAPAAAAIDTVVAVAATVTAADADAAIVSAAWRPVCAWAHNTIQMRRIMAVVKEWRIADAKVQISGRLLV